MAISPIAEFPGKVDPATTEFPFGKARNITLPGDGTGTPWDSKVVNDIFGFQQALLDAGIIVPSGTPDEVGASQYLDALIKVAAKAGVIELDSVQDMQLVTNSRGIVLLDGFKVITGASLWEITTVTTPTTVPTGLFAKLLNHATSDDFGGTNNTAVNLAVDASKGSQKVIISGEPTYDQDVAWKGKEHETAGLPFQLNSEPITGGALNGRMTVFNGNIYNCGFVNNKIEVFSLTDPRQPLIVNSFITASQPRHVDIVGRHAIVACHGASRIEFYDISNPSAASLVGTITTGANPKMFELAGNEIYVVCAGPNTLEKYTFQLPAEGIPFNSIKIGEVTVADDPLCCAFNGEGLVAVSGLTATVDLVGSSTLNLIDSTVIGGAGHGTCVWVTKTQLLVTDATNDTLISVNYENITTPAISKTISVVLNPEQIEIVGNRVYIAGLDTPAKLSAVDITDAKDPFEFKQVDLTINGAGFTTYYQDGNIGYLYVNGHFTPFNMEVIEVVVGEDDGRPIQVHENGYFRTLGVSKLDATMNNVFERYITTLVGITASIDDNVIRVGSGAPIALPDPELMKGKRLTITNVNAAGTSAVTNAFTGFSGTLAALASVTVVSMDFAGGFQWDAVAQFGTIT